MSTTNRLVKTIRLAGIKDGKRRIDNGVSMLDKASGVIWIVDGFDSAGKCYYCTRCVQDDEGNYREVRRYVPLYPEQVYNLIVDIDDPTVLY